jgi:hypothetical protein
MTTLLRLTFAGSSLCLLAAVWQLAVEVAGLWAAVVAERLGVW